MRQKKIEALPLMHAVSEHLQHTDQKSTGNATRVTYAFVCIRKFKCTLPAHTEGNDHICAHRRSYIS